MDSQSFAPFNWLVGSALAAAVALSDFFALSNLTLGVVNMTTAINLIAAGASGRRAVANGSDKACPGRNAPSPASFIWILPMVVTPRLGLPDL